VRGSGRLRNGKRQERSKDSAQEQKAPDQARHGAKERPRLRARFEKEVAPALLKELELHNQMAVPRLHKIVVNMGVGEATQNAKVLDPAVNELGQITGQKPVVTRRPRNRSRRSRCAKARPSAPW
jgi:large subunit ribosomal protein L5